MLYKSFELVQLSWPLGLVVLCSGIVYCGLLSVFPDAIDAFRSMRGYVIGSDWGAIETLFSMAAGVSGWISVVVAQRRLDANKLALFLVGLLCCVASIGLGFGSAAVFVGLHSDSVWEMMMYSLVSGAGACAFRGFISDAV